MRMRRAKSKATLEEELPLQINQIKTRLQSPRGSCELTVAAIVAVSIALSTTSKPEKRLGGAGRPDTDCEMETEGTDVARSDAEEVSGNEKS